MTTPLAAEEAEPNSAPSHTNEKDTPVILGSALVLGASGEQGQAVIDGLLTSGRYSPVFGATRDVSSLGAIDAANMGAILLQLDLDDPETVEKALLETQAKYIFFVTTTDLPPNSATAKEAEVSGL
jgi:uncharacterized protein YbjT (DUF2867 family)